MRTLSIKAKLSGGISILLAVCLTLLVLLTVQARSGSKRTDSILHRFNQKLSIAKDIQLETDQMKGAQRGLMLAYEAQDEGSAPQYIQLYEDSGAKLDSLLSQLSPLTDTPEEKEILDHVRQSRETWAPKFQNLIALCQSGKIKDAYALRNDNKTLSADMLAAANKLEGLQKEALDTSDKEATAATSRAVIEALLMACFTIPVGILVFLTVHKAVVALRNALDVLNQSAQEIAGAASQVSSSAQSLAQGSSRQAASIEETAASSTEIQSMARANADNSRSMAGLVDESKREIVQANSDLSAMVQSMTGINESSEKISKIIKVIDEIAFQTNILALNAAVEAARAGEEGQGFAVVADEVRNLAQRSAQAAHDTASLIQESIDKAQQGKKQVDRVVGSIQAISQSSTKIASLVDGIAAGSAEECRGLDQIAKAITQMEQVTQMTAASAEQSAASSEELNAQSETMRGLVLELNLLVNGAKEMESYGHLGQRGRTRPSSAASSRLALS
ncbi:MAG TPA: methyl-accepting chemotaxis protein [Terracidiphilus sp.]|nr:methyl-accepting chemotaxis protein [Terracidiphilus sp.]